MDGRYHANPFEEVESRPLRQLQIDQGQTRQRMGNAIGVWFYAGKITQRHVAIRCHLQRMEHANPLPGMAAYFKF